MLLLTNTPGDAPLADRLRGDLQAAGHPLTETVQKGATLIAILSPEAVTDTQVMATITQALDAGLHIIPVLASAMPLPSLIDHLEPLNFTNQYPLAALQNRIGQLSRPDTRPPVRVRTPAVRAANRRFGYVLVALAVLWFLIGVILVGGFGIHAPQEEFNTISTFEFATVQIYLSNSQPRTTEDALNFVSTVQAAPTAQRPLLIATATALVTTPTPDE
ncbi:MAG: toll/interleukin-1 receptor domain-containing protein [Anaerolineaceae bacterium]|nr:toll/interleukin-1 receptor domain-containing protein [Anaerolineaceae bacterium]